MTRSDPLAVAAGVSVQPLPPSRWPEYKSLRLLALMSDPHAFGSSYEREAAFGDELWSQRLAEHRNGRSWTFFAEAHDTGLVGMISGFRTGEDLARRAVHVYAMFVAPQARGRGVARALMARLLEELSSEGGIGLASLEVNTEQQGAVRLYRSFGFTVEETTLQTMGDGAQHLSARMAKLLA